jgi:hypothetical protein
VGWAIALTIVDRSCAERLAVFKSIIYLAKMPTNNQSVNGIFVYRKKAVQTLKRL